MIEGSASKFSKHKGDNNMIRKKETIFALRFYKETGSDIGSFSHEKFFTSFDELKNCYNDELNARIDKSMALMPTAWRFYNGVWNRILGF